MDPSTEIEGLLLNMENTIDSLYQLSFLIRNNRSRRSAFRRAETFGKNTDGQGKDIFEFYQVHDRNRAVDFIRHIRVNNGSENYPALPLEYERLIDQLAQASSKRRRVLFYLEQHGDKLDADLGKSPPKASLNDNSSSEPQVGAEPSIIGASTEATSFYRDTPIRGDDAHSQGFSISTGTAFDGTENSLPKPPNLARGKKEFECPYCHTWCPAEDTDPRRWK